MMSSRKVIASVFLGATANAVTLQRTEQLREKYGIKPFEAFLSEQGRSYTEGTPEFDERKALYERRADEQVDHNSHDGQLWEKGVNQFSDWYDHELNELHGWSGYASEGGDDSGAASLLQGADLETLPKEVNWGTLNATTRIQNQGHCGSCWAVTSASVLEAHSELHSPLGHRSFSAQEMVDCVPNPRKCGGDGGCKGATAELAFDYVMKVGIATTEKYPYLASTNKCKGNQEVSLLKDKTAPLNGAESGIYKSNNQGSVGFGMTGWEKLPENQYEPLLRALYERGPVAVSVGARTWQFYSRGILNNCDKDTVIGHAVMAMGYGEDKSRGVKYWKIQNSWGPRWGESGFIRIQRSDDDAHHCGTDKQPEKGTGCLDGPKQVKVCGMCGILYDSVVPHFAPKKKESSMLLQEEVKEVEMVSDEDEGAEVHELDDDEQAADEEEQEEDEEEEDEDEDAALFEDEAELSNEDEAEVVDEEEEASEDAEVLDDDEESEVVDEDEEADDLDDEEVVDEDEEVDEEEESDHLDDDEEAEDVEEVEEDDETESQAPRRRGR